MLRRVRVVLVVLAGVLVHAAPSAAQAVQVTPGTVHHQNIETAIKFLRDHGETQAADEIQKDLDDGDIYVDGSIDSNGETSATGNVSIHTNVAGHNMPMTRGKPLDPDRDFGAVVELARTLYHENVHANHQGVLDAVILREAGKERGAWRATIHALERWIRVERDKNVDIFYRPPTPSTTPANHERELRHINTKINILMSYVGSYRENDYFGADDQAWIQSVETYWQGERTQYIQPQLNEFEEKRNTPPPAGGGAPPPTGATGGTPTPPATPDPPKPPPAPEPAPEPPPPPLPCLPCQPIANQILELKAQLRTLTEAADKARTDLEDAQRRVTDLEKRARNLQRELQRSAGTGGSSFDPSTGVRIDAYDQGNGTVRVTTRDRNGNVIDDYTRDASARKAELAKQLEQTNADIAKAQADVTARADAAANAQKAVDAAADRLQQLVKELEDCIKKYCQTLSTGEALNMLGLPYPDLDTLADPTSFNTIGGDRDAPVQVMIIEIHVGGQPGLTVPGQARPASRGWRQDPRQPRSGVGALLAWLRPTSQAWMAGGHHWSADHRRPWSIDDAAAAQAGRRAPPVPPVQMLLTSLGQSMGQAFDLQVFNNSGRPLRLGANALVVEPLKNEAKRQVQGVVQRLSRTAAPVAAKLNGYCLEFLKLPPSAGTIFKVAAPELQRRFAPMRNIMDASRRVQQLGQLRPDSEPNGYFHSIRQWAMWTVEQKFNDRSFADAFVEHTRKAVTAANRPWNGEAEKVIRSAAPNRWADIQKILSAASQLAPAR